MAKLGMVLRETLPPLLMLLVGVWAFGIAFGWWATDMPVAYLAITLGVFSVFGAVTLALLGYSVRSHQATVKSYREAVDLLQRWLSEESAASESNGGGNGG